jgi:peroxiredoxin|nr:redoxin domain-containing protein [uncultured Emticicia sp.]
MPSSRKYIFVTIGLIFVVLIGYMVFGIFATAQKKKEIIANTQQLPNFKATQLDKHIFASNDLPTKPTVIIFFNTECEHCQYEAKEIAQNRAAFEGINLLMISSEEISKIKAFVSKYQLMGFAKPLQMDIKTMIDTFGAVSIPTIFIHRKDRQLIKQYKGETKVESIIKYIK